jgi:hypothetical protein
VRRSETWEPCCVYIWCCSFLALPVLVEKGEEGTTGHHVENQSRSHDLIIIFIIKTEGTVKLTSG